MYQRQIFKVSGAHGKQLGCPKDAWNYYDKKWTNGELQHLPPRMLTPPIDPISDAKIPINNPWPGEAHASVVYHGIIPGRTGPGNTNFVEFEGSLTFCSIGPSAATKSSDARILFTMALVTTPRLFFCG